ncbi:hypothetical protein C4K25_1536 [Pseudomonas chlororaphis]|nr:hypothetical protein C4K25_1536 [Pseudomonas chlororaphis]
MHSQWACLSLVPAADHRCVAKAQPLMDKRSAPFAYSFFRYGTHSA